MSKKTQAPNWQKDAVLTVNGWRHPKTKELLVAMKVTQKEVDDYYKLDAKEEVVEPEVKKPKKVKRKATKKKATKKKAAPVVEEVETEKDEDTSDVVVMDIVVEQPEETTLDVEEETPVAS